MNERMQLAEALEELLPHTSADHLFTLGLTSAQIEMVVIALRAPKVGCGCGPMCEDKGHGNCRYHDVSPTRKALRSLVDAVWRHATDSTAVPATDTADRLITKMIIPSHEGPAQPIAAAAPAEVLCSFFQTERKPPCIAGCHYPACLPRPSNEGAGPLSRDNLTTKGE